MKVLSWNIRGLNAPSKQRLVRSVRLRYEVDVVLLQETKLDQAKENEVFKKI